MLHTARATRGMVTASHRLAAEAGLRVLREGGNAVEATVAAAAAISVVYPHMNGIGGDGFWLISTPNKRAPDCIMGVGAAGSAVTPEFYTGRGLDAIPSRGPLAANTVAGTVSSWDAALAVSREWGKALPLERLLEDAIWYAREGVPVTRLHCENVAAKKDEMADVPGWDALFRPDGGDPRPGDLIKQAALAETLETLAHDGLDSFYRGALAERIAGDLERAGSPLTLRDLNAHRGWTGAAASAAVSGATLYNCPPPTQGLVSLMILALFDRLKRPDPEGFDHVHRMVEAFKQAAMIRNDEITDPAYMERTPAEILAGDVLDALATEIDPVKALPWPQSATPGDTVWLGAVDGEGRAVSFIHSIYWEFGSGTVLEDTGIQWQNRGSSFSLAEGEQNYLEPGRKPFHTNNPALALLDDGRVMVYGSMGGEGQPQTQSAVFSRYAWYGQELQTAVTAPRWLLGRTWGQPKIELQVEDRFGPDVIKALEKAGHAVKTLGAFDPLLGHAGALVLHPSGLIEGASDPRSDGAAAGY